MLLIRETQFYTTLLSVVNVIVGWEVVGLIVYPVLTGRPVVGVLDVGLCEVGLTV